MTGTPTKQQFDLLTQVIRHVARSGRLSPDVAADFEQSVHLTLLEKNYDIFQRFGGRSTLRTFLTVVIRRLLLDWRNRSDGKWRPSAAAQRLGPHAMALERLIYRDGYTRNEAVEVLRSRQSWLDPNGLSALIDELPPRRSTRIISTDALPEIVDLREVDAVDRDWLEARERRRRAAVADALRRLPEEDRRLLRMRFAQGRTVRAVAQSLQIDAKVLYRRYDRVLRSLRRAATSTEV
jgi:RNA polymerase sigma factor (sigma-70 family)